VIAAGDLKQASGIGKLALFHIFDPGAANSEWYLIFSFTGNAASMTTNTGLIIDEKTIIHLGFLCLELSSFREKF
jgi:hypothetical protein